MFFRILLALACLCATAISQAPPDIIIFNADVRTMEVSQPSAQAVAITGGKISAVGTNVQIRRLARVGTRQIDARGRLLIPGFNDSHVHFMAIGNSFSSVDQRNAKTGSDVLSEVSRYSLYLPEGRWILGSGLDASISIPLAAIDGAAPRNPLLIYHADTRSAIVNSAAAALAKVELAPQQSTVVSGEALRRIQSAVPADHTRDWPAIAQTATSYAASLGITSVQDTHSDDSALILKNLERAGKLKTRVYDCTSLSDVTKFSDGARGEGESMVRRGCLKDFVEEVEDDVPSIAGRIIEADSKRAQILLHAIGDDAIEGALSLLERAANKKDTGRRHRLEHASGIDIALLTRVRNAGIVLSMQPALFFRASGANDDYRELLRQNVPIAFGSDAPMRSFDPLQAIYAAVNAGVERGISVEEAVRIHTLGSAYAEHQEHLKGSVRVGKYADLVVLSSNIFAANADIRGARVVLTLVNGRVVHENREFEASSKRSNK